MNDGNSYNAALDDNSLDIVAMFRLPNVDAYATPYVMGKRLNPIYNQHSIVKHCNIISIACITNTLHYYYY